MGSLVVLCSFPQGYPGLLWELSWLCSSPADTLALGVVNIPEIIQRPSLPNLQHAHQIFTDGDHSDHCCNYILKIHWHQTCLFARGLAHQLRCWCAGTWQPSRIPKLFCGCRACYVVWLQNKFGSICSNQSKWAFKSGTEVFIYRTEKNYLFSVCWDKRTEGMFCSYLNKFMF